MHDVEGRNNNKTFCADIKFPFYLTIIIMKLKNAAINIARSGINWIL
jgi:hypothetical protein